jgi:hypothetical protein
MADPRYPFFFWRAVPPPTLRLHRDHFGELLAGRAFTSIFADHSEGQDERSGPRIEDATAACKASGAGVTKPRRNHAADHAVLDENVSKASVISSPSLGNRPTNIK